ncbi:MAG: type II toxin-antitoxin system YafQ family toxin [Paludibacteraceae bacterium]|nr:type II toxin-antitoxin system YafQ family toxin [Paludibacteraceae bacterium]
MYSLCYAPKFLHSVKRCKQQGKDLTLLWDTVQQLVTTGRVPDSYSPHMLEREYMGYFECHIEDDWLLIWKQNDEKLTLVFFDTGTHEELFKKKYKLIKKHS